jgi:hypothetical protein
LFKQTQESFAVVLEVFTEVQLRTPLPRPTLQRVRAGFRPSTQCRRETSAEE